MDSEDIGLDFDCDISPERSDHQVWHSDEENSSHQPDAEASEPPNDVENKAENGDSSKTPSTSSEDSPI